MTKVPYGKQSINEADIDAVVQVLRADWLTQGPKVPEFEQAMTDYCGVDYAVAVNSATSALHIACLALGLGKGDLLWTSPNTFVASANCARYCGADVDFVDIDPDTWNMSVSALAAKLEIAQQTGCLPKIVLPVHFSGQSCEMEAIHELSKKYGFYILEDAAHAIGGRYQQEPIGSCRYSDIVVFSFHPVKIITTGEGGMALTNNVKLAESMARLRSHGITRDPNLMSKGSDGPWYYQQIDLGFNYRMTDVHAALGESQLRRLDTFVTRRNELAQRYNELLAEFPLQLPTILDTCYSSWHLYVICLQLDEISKSHRQVFEAMRSSGIGVQLHYIPVYLQPYYQNLGFTEGDYPNTENYYQRAFSLPIFPELSVKSLEKIVTDLQGIIE